MYNLDPEKDRNRYNSEMHFRLFHPKSGLPTVVCMQDFDYRDYDYSRFMTYEGYKTEEEALAALHKLDPSEIDHSYVGGLIVDFETDGNQTIVFVATENDTVHRIRIMNRGRGTT